MKATPLSIVLMLLAVGVAFAQSAPEVPRNPSCAADATTKKLAGAAKTSFMKKCETDSATACDAAAAAKKLNGAAKTSFTKKCLSDSVGSN